MLQRRSASVCVLSGVHSGSGASMPSGTRRVGAPGDEAEKTSASIKNPGLTRRRLNPCRRSAPSFPQNYRNFTRSSPGWEEFVLGMQEVGIQPERDTGSIQRPGGTPHEHGENPDRNPGSGSVQERWSCDVPTTNERVKQHHRFKRFHLNAACSHTPPR